MSGYSPNISSPAYDKNRQQSSKSYIIKVIIIAIIAGALLAIIDPLLGVFVGGVILVVGILQGLKDRRAWDGEIQSKDQTDSTTTEPDGSITSHITYILKVARSTGKVETLKWHHNPDAFDYYRVGEQVRHHSGYDFPEKFDKSSDDQVICIACGILYAQQEVDCPKCQVPLLK